MRNCDTEKINSKDKAREIENWNIMYDVHLLIFHE